MSLKFLHTADYHIGKLFHEYDCNYEHQHFLDWLVRLLKTKLIDVLLINGDIFDISNPSAQSIRIFYTFLNQVTTTNPNYRLLSLLETTIPLQDWKARNHCYNPPTFMILWKGYTTRVTE